MSKPSGQTTPRCEQPNCGFPATALVLSDEVLFILCDSHQGELLAMGGDFETVFRFDSPTWLADARDAINHKFDFRSKKYSKLLGEYTEAKKALEAEAADSKHRAKMARIVELLKRSTEMKVRTAATGEFICYVAVIGERDYKEALSILEALAPTDAEQDRDSNK